MNDAPKVDSTKYVWVITEQQPGQDETFVGLSTPEGAPFLPVCDTKEDALMLLGRLPKGEGKRQAEAIHREGLLEEARKDGFAVYLVDPEGILRERLDSPEH
ncbi:hypothetical protein AAU61_19545 [Desulfocarbo indianensis]|nr:hypothetical protein AAU61_19545 [Desulfocarbo indianensis]